MGVQQRFRWQDSENFRLRHLASLRATAFHPEMDDVWEQHDGSIRMNFGDRTETIWLQDVSGGAEQLFMNGFCVLFAYALHEQLGLPFAILTDHSESWGGWSGHVGLMLDDELFLDLYGVRPLQEVVEQFALMNYSYDAVDKDEFLNLLVDAPLHNNPMLFVEELEQLVTEDFVMNVIQSHEALRVLHQHHLTAMAS